MSICDLQESKSVVCSICSPGKEAPASGHTAVTRPGTTGAGPGGQGWPAGGKGLQMLVLGGRAHGEWASPCSPHGPHSGSCWGVSEAEEPHIWVLESSLPSLEALPPIQLFLETQGVGVASPAPKDRWATRMELVSRTWSLPGAQVAWQRGQHPGSLPGRSRPQQWGSGDPQKWLRLQGPGEGAERGAGCPLRRPRDPSVF